MDEHPIDPRPMRRVVSVVPLEDLHARLRFDDDSVKTVDLDPYLRPNGPMVGPIRSDAALFRAVTVDHGTIGWPNGLDLDPDALYCDDLMPTASRANASDLATVVGSGSH